MKENQMTDILTYSLEKKKNNQWHLPGVAEPRERRVATAMTDLSEKSISEEKNVTSCNDFF
jgi:hypothetical protein